MLSAWGIKGKQRANWVLKWCCGLGRCGLQFRGNKGQAALGQMKQERLERPTRERKKRGGGNKEERVTGLQRGTTGLTQGAARKT